MEAVKKVPEGTGVETEDEVRARLKTHLAQPGASQARVARAIGMTGSAVSQWLGDKYQGDNATVSQRIASYLALDGQRVEAPKGAGFVQTAVAKDVHTVCQYSHVNRDIGLVYGEAGMGKTYALREYQRAHPDTILLRCNPSWKTPQAMLEAVLLEVGRKVRGMNALHRHIRELVGALEETGRLVIPDEAQFLGTRSLEVVRTLHDEAEVGIVLSGNLDVYSQMHGEGMASFAQLFSRVGIRRQILLGAPREDVERIATAITSGIDEDALTFLVEKTHERGGVRRMVKILTLGSEVAGGATAQIQRAHLVAAERMLIGGRA